MTGAGEAAPETGAGAPPPRRRRWPWLAGGAVILVAAAIAVGATVIAGDDGPPAYCSVLDDGGQVGYVHLEADAPESVIDEVGADLAAVDGLVGLTYVGREQSFEETKELYADQPTGQALLRAEDIPTSYRFGLPDGSSADAIRADVEGRDGVLSSDIRSLRRDDDGRELPPIGCG